MTRQSSIAIDEKLAQELRAFAFEKHGTTYRAIKEETEEAIKKHIRRG